MSNEQDIIIETLGYCLAHCDTQTETDTVLWVADKLTEARVLPPVREE